MNKNKIFSDTLIYTVLPKLPVIASFVTLPIITPYLTLSDYGKFGLITAYLAVFTMIVVLGQAVVLQNSFFVYKKNYVRIWRRVHGLMVIAALAMTVCFSLLIYLTLFNEFSVDFFLVSGLCFLVLIVTPIETIAQVYYVLNEKPYPMAIRSIILGFVSALLLVVTMRYYKLGYLGWVISGGFTSLFTLVFYGYPLIYKEKIYPILNFNKRHVKRFLKVGIPLLPHNLALYIFNSSDRLILSWFKIDVKQIGIYSQGYNLGANGMVLITGIFSALAKTLQNLYRDPTEENILRLRKLFYAISFSVSFLCFLGALWMKEVYFVFFRNPDLQGGYIVAGTILMSYIYMPLYQYASYPLSIKGKTALISKISLSAALINIILNIIMIPFIGYWAAVISTYISFMLFGMACLLFERIKTEMEFVFKSVKFTYLIIMGVNLLGSVAVIFIVDLSYITKTLFSLLLAIIFYILIKRFVLNSKNEYSVF